MATNVDSATAARWLLPVTFLSIALAVYANAISTPFLFDDLDTIVHNKSLNGFSWREVWRQHRGFAFWTLAWNRHSFGLSPWSYHVTNVLIHTAAALFLSGIVRQTLAQGSFDERLKRDANWVAWLVGIIWLVHPLNTESVTYVTQRLESLMGCLALFGLYALARSRCAKFAWPWLLGSLLALLFGARTKETMIAIPVLYVWYDRVFLAHSWRELFQRRGWYYATVSGAWVLFYGSLVSKVSRLVTPQFGPSSGTSDVAQSASESLGIVAGLTPLRYLASQPGVILHYLRLAIWPDGLCIDYVWPLPSSTSQILFPGLIVVSGLILSGWWIWYWPRWGFLVGCFWITLATRSSILPRSDLAVEHRMYLPLASLVVVGALMAHKLLGKAGGYRQRFHEKHLLPLGRRAAAQHDLTATWNRSWQITGWSFIVVLVTALGLCTHFRNRDYQTPLRLWTATLAESPNNPRAMTNLGLALFELGRIDEAILWYRRAIKQESLLEYDQFALFNLGNALVQQKRLSEAIHSFTKAVAIAPDLAAAHNNLAYGYLELEQLESAKHHAQRAVELDADYAGAWLNLGIVTRRLGQLAEAQSQLQRAVTLDPASAAAQHQLGLLLADQGQLNAAQRCFVKALELDEHRVESHVALADLLRSRGQFADAVGSRRSALALHPHDAACSIELARDLAASGKHAEASDLLQRTIERDPAEIQARLVLGDVWAAAGDWKSAIRQYRQTKAAFATDERPYHKLAIALEAIGDFDAARLEWDSAIAAAPSSEFVFRQFAEFLLRSGDPVKTIESCQRGVALYPDSYHLLTLYGLALEKHGDINDATEAYVQAIVKNPKFPPARMNLAACLAAQGKVFEAMTQYDATLKLDPRNVAAHNNLANLLTRMGQPLQAIAHYEQALAIDPTFEPARSNLTRARELLARQK